MKFLILFLIIGLKLFIIESKYEVILDRVEQIDDGTFWDLGTTRIRKFNRSSAVISGISTIKFPLDDSVSIEFEAFNLSGGQYKKIFGYNIGTFCDIAYRKEGEDVARRVLASTNTTTKYGACPIPPQTIQINDISTDGIGDILPEYIPGNERWKVDIRLIKNKKIYFNLIGYGLLRDTQKLFDSKW